MMRCCIEESPLGLVVTLSSSNLSKGNVGAKGIFHICLTKALSSVTPRGTLRVEPREVEVPQLALQQEPDLSARSKGRNTAGEAQLQQTTSPYVRSNDHPCYGEKILSNEMHGGKGDPGRPNRARSKGHFSDIRRYEVNQVGPSDVAPDRRSVQKRILSIEKGEISKVKVTPFRKDDVDNDCTVAYRRDTTITLVLRDRPIPDALRRVQCIHSDPQTDDSDLLDREISSPLVGFEKDLAAEGEVPVDVEKNPIQGPLTSSELPERGIEGKSAAELPLHRELTVRPGKERSAEVLSPGVQEERGQGQEAYVEAKPIQNNKVGGKDRAQNGKAVREGLRISGGYREPLVQVGHADEKTNQALGGFGSRDAQRAEDNVSRGAFLGRRGSEISMYLSSKSDLSEGPKKGNLSWPGRYGSPGLAHTNFQNVRDVEALSSSHKRGKISERGELSAVPSSVRKELRDSEVEKGGIPNNAQSCASPKVQEKSEMGLPISSRNNTTEHFVILGENLATEDNELPIGIEPGWNISPSSEGLSGLSHGGEGPSVEEEHREITRSKVPHMTDRALTQEKLRSGTPFQRELTVGPENKATRRQMYDKPASLRQTLNSSLSVDVGPREMPGEFAISKPLEQNIHWANPWLKYSSNYAEISLRNKPGHPWTKVDGMPRSGREILRYGAASKVRWDLVDVSDRSSGSTDERTAGDFERAFGVGGSGEVLALRGEASNTSDTQSIPVGDVRTIVAKIEEMSTRVARTDSSGGEIRLIFRTSVEGAGRIQIEVTKEPSGTIAVFVRVQDEDLKDELLRASSQIHRVLAEEGVQLARMEVDVESHPVGKEGPIGYERPFHRGASHRFRERKSREDREWTG